MARTGGRALGNRGKRRRTEGSPVIGPLFHGSMRLPAGSRNGMETTKPT